MNYFDEHKKTLSLDNILQYNMFVNGYDDDSFYAGFSSDNDVYAFDEDEVIEKIMVQDGMTDILTENQKEILIMYFLEDKTQDEIAEELHIHQSVVSRAKKRGVEKLKEQLNPLDERGDTL